MTTRITSAADLTGRAAIVSGAGSGIGKALARHAATHLDMQVIVADIDAGRAEEVAAGIRAEGGRAAAEQCDVADWDSTDSLATRVTAEHGAPALLACNAGVELTGLLWETSPQDWERVQGINVSGAFHLARAFVPSMLDAGRRGHVVCTSSVAGFGVFPSQAAYMVSKHAIRVLAQTLASDLASVGADIGVSVLVPGVVDTPIFRDAATTGTAAAEEARRSFAAHLAGGMDPTVVAAATFAGILSGRQWIHPEPDLSRKLSAAHLADLVGGMDET